MKRTLAATLLLTLPLWAEPEATPQPAAQEVEAQEPAPQPGNFPQPEPLVQEPAASTAEAAPTAQESAPAKAEAAPVKAEPAPTATPAPRPLTSSQTPAAYYGIVKIEVAVHRYDYGTPWLSGGFGVGNGTGFLVGPGLFMTNAHVVANAERIYISPYADARKFRAHVRHVAHDADLALVEVEEKEAFADVPRLEFSDRLPKLEDSVRAIGYPIGGDRLSVTRGIVSRIDTIPYSHPRNQNHLSIQVDAAINPGNSGGPVLMGDKVIGVAFQGLLDANSTGYVIPLPVIERFLKDVQDGRYDGYVDLGVTFLPLENAGMRKHYNVQDGAVGALVSDVVAGGTCDGVLKPGDIVLAVNGHSVDNSAMIELDGERVSLKELAERAFNGDKLHFTILRDGKQQEAEAALKALPANDIGGNEYDKHPRYVVFAGLVFQPLQLNVIQAHRLTNTDFMVEMDEFINKGGFREKEDIVILTKTLPDEVNARFKRYGRRIVTKVNGEEVKGLSHLYSLLYPQDGQPRPDYTVIEFAGAPRPLVIDNTDADDANARISAGYNVPEQARLK